MTLTPILVIPEGLPISEMNGECGLGGRSFLLLVFRHLGLISSRPKWVLVFHEKERKNVYH